MFGLYQPLTYSMVSSFSFVGFLYSRRKSALAMTETKLKAIAAEPIHGSNLIPIGLNTPAATGIPTMLYTEANTKFSHILSTVFCDKSKQAITSRRLFLFI